MKGLFSKKIVLALALTVLVGGSFLVPGVAEAQTFPCTVPTTSPTSDTLTETIFVDDAEACEEAGGVPGTSTGVGAQATVNTAGGWAIEKVAIWIVTTIMTIAGWLTGLSAVLLNGVLHYTVVNVSQNYANIDAIREGWGVMRDLANMLFIFILLYAAIKTILGLGNDNKELIKNVIIIAVLINFSLFFTRLVIDASNILALFFYDAMAPGALTEGATGGSWNASSWGLSNAFMEPLRLQSLYDASNINLQPGQLITVGVMGTILLLIASFVFFAVAILFIIRYVVLILVLILSPIAFIAWVMPDLKKYKDQWVGALTGQAFFAPIYFVLTYVTLRILTNVLGSINETFGGTDVNPDSSIAGLADIGSLLSETIDGSFAMFINFAIVIVFLVASLIISKEWANKAGGGINKVTGWATGFAGNATFGAVGFAGRQTVGRAGQAVAESETLKKAREWSNKRGGIIGTTVGTTTRFAQNRAKSVGSGSFDLRSTGISGQLDAGKAGGKGGYEAWRKEVDKKEEEYAKSQGPSEKTKAKAKKQRGDADADIAKADAAITRLRAAGYSDDSAEIEVQNFMRKDAEKRKGAADSVLGNKEEIEKNVKSEDTKRKKEIERIKNDEELKASELAERSAQDTVNRLEAEAKAAIGTVDEDRRKAEVEAAKEKLKMVQEAAKEMRRVNKETIERVSNEYDEKIESIKNSEVKSAADRRKISEADKMENSRWAKVRGYNYTAAAKIRGQKSKAEQLYEEVEKKIKEESDSSSPAPEPPPPTAGGGSPTP